LLRVGSRWGKSPAIVKEERKALVPKKKEAFDQSSSHTSIAIPLIRRASPGQKQKLKGTTENSRRKQTRVQNTKAKIQMPGSDTFETMLAYKDKTSPVNWVKGKELKKGGGRECDATIKTEKSTQPAAKTSPGARIRPAEKPSSAHL